MNKTIVGAALGLAALAASTAASAHSDVAIVPATVYSPAPAYAARPAAYAPALVAVGYRDHDYWRAREWRERERRRHEWREHEWREHEWREHEWREHHRWD
jgi:hypothetical protein